MKRAILAFLAAGVWISISEFMRNELLFKSLWIEKYASLGLEFPSALGNNLMWGLWSFILAFAVVYILSKLGVIETMVMIWLMAFVMMWIVIGNLNVLPYALLLAAVPLSIIEVAVAVIISSFITRKEPI
jgi:hypothetical protein